MRLRLAPSLPSFLPPTSTLTAFPSDRPARSPSPSALDLSPPAGALVSLQPRRAAVHGPPSLSAVISRSRGCRSLRSPSCQSARRPPLAPDAGTHPLTGCSPAGWPSRAPWPRPSRLSSSSSSSPAPVPPSSTPLPLPFPSPAPRPCALRLSAGDVHERLQESRFAI